MNKKLIYVLVGLIIISLATLCFAAPKDDALALVKKAAAFYKANGKDKLVAEINKPNGQFVKGDVYVFIWTLNYSVLAHPANPKLIGMDMTELKDPDGKRFVYEAVELAKAKGSGWVDYRYTNPVKKKVEAKTTYVLKVDDLILACGIYK